MEEENQNQYFDISILNSKTLILNPKTPTFKSWLDKFHLKKVDFNSSFSLNIGDKVYIKYTNTMTPYETYYVNNHMYKEDKLRYRINEFEENVSSVYVLPLIGLKKEHLLMEHNFINCYAYHYNFKHKDGEYVYLIYRYLPITYYSKFIEAVQKQKHCIHYAKEQDQRFDCFIFKIEDKFINDAKLIMSGKFSKITDEAKKIILYFHNQTNPESPLSQVLYKGDLRRNELEMFFGCIMPDNIDFAEKPNKNEETWKMMK